MSNSDSKPLTGVRKRQQIDNARKQVVIWVAAAGCCAVIAIIVGIRLWQKIQYQNKVNSQLQTAEKTLKSNVSAIDTIRTNVDALKSNERLNLTQLKSDDQSPLQVVLDAMPTQDNRTALGSALQDKVLSLHGATIQNLTVISDDSTSSASTDTASSSASGDTSTLNVAATPIEFSVELSGDYNSIQKTIEDMERSIRTIVINSMSIDGSDDKLTVKIVATTYYAPKINYKTSTTEVKGD